MITIEQLAQAALNGESLRLRSLTQDLLREQPLLSAYPKPQTQDPRLLTTAAALLELLAGRLHQAPPPWTSEIGALADPVYLLKEATQMKRLRAFCETEAPEPLRKRGLYAPPNFLEFV
jgi:hypothetical protein